MDEHVVYFAHGKESGPWGEKIVRLAKIAELKGFHVESPDYSGMFDPQERIEKLLDLKPCAGKHLVLAGSSMGGYVSTVASQTLKPSGLFLLAPAFFREDYEFQNPSPTAQIVEIVHGWDDELIAAEDIVRYAKQYKIRLSLLAGDHRLISAMPQIEKIFSSFLDDILRLDS